MNRIAMLLLLLLASSACMVAPFDGQKVDVGLFHRFEGYVLNSTDRVEIQAWDVEKARWIAVARPQTTGVQQTLRNFSGYWWVDTAVDVDDRKHWNGSRWVIDNKFWNTWPGSGSRQRAKFRAVLVGTTGGLVTYATPVRETRECIEEAETASDIEDCQSPNKNFLYLYKD
jgi:hypothetical protein